jgi:hypothetical protein
VKDENLVKKEACMLPELISEGIQTIILAIGAVAVPVLGLILFFGLMVKLASTKHKEKIAMIEHGLTEPPRARRGNGLLVAGLVFTGIGIALVIGIPIAGEASGVVGGLMPLFIGLALILGHRLSRRGE